ncbi:methyltransferase domain-containing protein [Haloferula rosea]|uniref:Methyltransferase domain-containing protein n=1 Tax=Haloferula rosea TaxID=490093 RepID=A0A934R955_9BACT|nr:methyltransferase domain-containing protein [Haloferula rosea]MBK1826627.1 methyltransferase domain-containing protein [Haloferula rosea]
MPDNPYESRKLLSEYLLFHYGRPSEILPEHAPQGMEAALDFAVRTPGHFSDGEVSRALDLGCAVGRSSYEMSRSCREVVGIDFSHSFVQAADSLRHGPLDYERIDEAHLQTALEARLPEGVDPARVRFEQGDAMFLRADLGRFDRLHAANLICRLTEPRLLLERLPDLLVSGGELVLATPCTWLGEFTRPEFWPEGSTLEWLQKHLDHAFLLESSADEPFLIRETSRKFQWTASQVTRWKRK